MGLVHAAALVNSMLGVHTLSLVQKGVLDNIQFKSILKTTDTNTECFKKEQLMVFLIYYGIGWIVGLIVAFLTASMKDIPSAANTLLLWHLVVTVGLTGLLSSYMHIFKGEQIAKSIGWAPGSLFQVELGYCCLGMGVLGVMCYWFRDYFWLATIVFTSAFLVGAALVHIKEMMQNKNFNAGNAITTIPDFIIPITLFVLWFMAKK